MIRLAIIVVLVASASAAQAGWPRLRFRYPPLVPPPVKKVEPKPITTPVVSPSCPGGNCNQQPARWFWRRR